MSDVDAMGLAMLAAREALHEAWGGLTTYAVLTRTRATAAQSQADATLASIDALTAAIDAAGIERPEDDER